MVLRRALPVLNRVTLMTGAAVALETLETKCCNVVTMAVAATTGSTVKCGMAAAQLPKSQTVCLHYKHLQQPYVPSQDRSLMNLVLM